MSVLPSAAPTDIPAVRTLADLASHVARAFPRSALVRQCQADGTRDISSAEWFDRVRHLALGYRDLGIKSGDRVAIVSESRPEWSLNDLAILSLGAITVPIYPTLPATQIKAILEDSGSRLAIVSDHVQLEKVQQIRHLTPTLEAVAVIDPPQSDAKASAAVGSVLTCSAIESRGAQALNTDPSAAHEYENGLLAIAPDALATIVYTSGTTGEPKGVMLTHHNILSNVMTVAEILDVGPRDVALTFLPLSHAFERMTLYTYLYYGVTVVFAESSETLARDLRTAKPTLMTGVPRVFEKIHARVLDNVKATSAFRQRLFHWAVDVGLSHMKATHNGRPVSMPARLKHQMADRLVFQRIRERTGGRLRFLVSGSAPLQPAIAEFFFAVGLPLLEGYGLTETSPVVAANRLETPRIGTVGQVIPGVEVRIAEDGEILVRGPNVMLGYYKRPDETAEVIKEGWLHTGDIGELSLDGYLSITDRKKDLIKTSAGKYIAPQPIEGLMRANPLVSEAVVLADRRKFAVMLIVPSFPNLLARLASLGRPEGSWEALATRDDVVSLYQEIVDGLNRELAQHERIKRIALLPVELSIATGELTPTLKVRRAVIEEKFRTVVDGLYEDR